MPSITDVSSIKYQYNFLTEETIPQSSGIWNFYFYFLTNKSELTGNGYDTVVEDDEADESWRQQSMEYHMFDQINTAQKDAFKFIMGLSTTQGAYEYTVLFTDVVSNLNFSDTDVATQQAITADTAHINIGQVAIDLDGDQTQDATGDGSTASAYTRDAYNPGEAVPWAYDLEYATRAHGDIWLNKGFYLGWNNINSGSAQLSTVIHEIAHALGLRHPASLAINSMKYTIMSSNYLEGMTVNLNPDGSPVTNSDVVEPSGLQMYDILAIQQIFESRDYDTRDDHTEYKIGQGFGSASTPFIYTIWDGAGVDVIDASEYADKVKIDLRQGEFSSIGKALNTTFAGERGTGLVDNNVGIAFYTVIENAKGTAGDDLLIGNAWNNVLFGGDGDDKLYGDGVSYDGNAGFHEADEYRAWNTTENLAPDTDDSGDDVLIGGLGNDGLYGGLGNDVLHGGFKVADINSATTGWSVGWNSAGQFPGSGDDIAYASDGSDTALYTSLTAGIAVTATSATALTVAKGAAGALGTDHLYSIEAIWGGNGGSDTFTGVKDGGSIYYRGQNGYDTYVFDVAVDRGFATLIDTGMSGTDILKLSNVGTNILISKDPYNANGVVFSQIQEDPQDPAIPLLVLNLAGGLERVEFNGTLIEAHQLIGMADANTDATNLPDAAAVYNMIYSAGVGGSDAGGGVLPVIDGGTIKSLQVRPDITGRYMDYAYTNEYLHPFIITNYTGGSGGCTMTFDSYLQSIQMVDGISAEDVRFTVSGTQGNASLTIHIDALGESHTIQYYETGKTLSGIATYDSALHAWVQGIGGSLQGSGGPGQYQGNYTQEYTLSTGLVQVTYFLEAMHFGNDPSIDLQQAMTFTGTSAGETLYGLDTRGDTLKGLAGNDDLRGYGGDDTLIGGTGADQLTGGLGNDTYFFEAGFSSGSGSYDTIYEYVGEGTDKIVFGSGINADDVRTWTDYYGYLHIQSVDNPNDVIRVLGNFAAGGTDVNQRLEQIAFADSTVWDLTQGLILNDSDDAHSGIYGSAQGDTIHGNGGNDDIRGWDGDDTISGGTGADQLSGGLGDDTFVFENGFADWNGGSGNDIVYEYLNEGFDTLHFGDGLTPDDLRMWTTYDGYLHIQSALDPQDYVRVLGNFTSYGVDVNQRIEQITFSDETVWDLTQGLILNDSDDAHSGIYGSAQGDTIHGNGGNDDIRGWDGDDTISGGTGSDMLGGGLGADTFVFLAEDVGTGSDTLWDFSLAEGDKIDLRDVLDAGYDPIADALADFVQLTNSGSNSIMSVDMDGTGTTYGWTQIATVYNHTNLDPDAMVTAGQLLAA